MAELVTLGECMVSFIATSRGPLAASETFLRVVAGAEANLAVGLARLGHEVAYVGRVGDDPWGTLIRRTLRGEGVDVRRLVTDPGAPTGLMMRELRDIGPMEVVYHRAGSAASRTAPDDVHEAIAAGVLEDARWVHVTGITPALSASAAGAVEALIAAGRARGATVSLDLNIRRRLWDEATAAATLRRLLARCDVVLGGLDESALVGGIAPTLEAATGTDPVVAADALIALGPRRALVKVGADGVVERAVLADGSRVTRRAPGVPVRVVDPVGAGDAFDAAWIAYTLEGRDPELALRAGNAAGAAVVASVGDLTAVPTRRELEALLAATGPDTIR